jgi:hypothetical protein
MSHPARFFIGLPTRLPHPFIVTVGLSPLNGHPNSAPFRRGQLVDERSPVSWNRFAITPMTVSAWTRFESPVRAKLNVKRNDLRIAAIAKEIGATVVTRNRRDFGRVPGLLIEDWAT